MKRYNLKGVDIEVVMGIMNDFTSVLQGHISLKLEKTYWRSYALVLKAFETSKSKKFSDTA